MQMLAPAVYCSEFEMTKLIKFQQSVSMEILGLVSLHHLLGLGAFLSH